LFTTNSSQITSPDVLGQIISIRPPPIAVGPCALSLKGEQIECLKKQPYFLN